MSKGKVLVVVGAQWGSEGKGVIVHHLAREYNIHLRVGAPNAGHSFYHGGDKVVMQSIPIGWANSAANVVIGAGAVLSPEIFLREVDMIAGFDRTAPDRIMIDGAASILSQAEHEAEGGIHGEIHQRIGSTGEGVGATRIKRLQRDPERTGFKLARDVPELSRWVVEDTASWMTRKVLNGANLLLEGAQGSGLSLIHGPWPTVTTAESNAAGFIADAGLSPLLVTDIMLVARTFPIRVAGNSGPLFQEITWEQLSQEVGRPLQERTTVTKKVRRVGRWDDLLFMKACMLNLPTAVALTFTDYLSRGQDEGKTRYDDLSPTTMGFIDYVERLARCPVTLIGTGGPRWAVIDRRREPAT